MGDEMKQTMAALNGMMSRPPRTPIERKPDEVGLQYEDVTFTTPDGVKLEGWFIPAGSSDKVVIVNHFSPGTRYGYPGHKEPFTAAGGFEVNQIPKYKALHDAGYSVLTYDMRNHGTSGEAAKGICGVGYLEWEDVVGSIEYVEKRFPAAAVHLHSQCMGCNATLVAMTKKPEAFANVKSLVAVQPLNGATFLQRTCEMKGWDPVEGQATFDALYKETTGLTSEAHDMNKYIPNVKVPTFLVQVRNDLVSRASDIEKFYADLPNADKKLYFIEDTPVRFHGYTYFSEHPEQMVDWYNKH